MRATLIIAQREYLSYVATVGFWLSLLAIPIFATIGGVVPALIEGTQPTRYFTVIDETGQGLDRLVRERLATERRANIRRALETTAGLFGGEEASKRALELFDSDPDGYEGLQAAADEIGFSGLGEVFEAGNVDMVQIDAPARTADALRPYLTGDRSLDTEEGKQNLFAAIIFKDHESEPLEAFYYSTNVTNYGVRSKIIGFIRSHLREQAYIAKGLSPQDVKQINNLRPKLVTINARADTQDDAVVTNADRAPFVAAFVFAFVLWIAIFSVANMLLTSMTEEKGGKIIELMLSSARLHEILIGKLFGVAGVSITLFLVWGLIGFSLSTYGNSVLPFDNPDALDFIANLFDPVLVFAAFCFFVVGYLMYGSIFLAIGSLCDTLQDAQTLMGPIIWMLMLPMIFIMFSIESPDSAFLRFASWVPIWTPFIMMARLPNEVPMLEMIVSCALMIGTMIIVLWGATVVFNRGALGHASAESVRRMFRVTGRSKTKG